MFIYCGIMRKPQKKQNVVSGYRTALHAPTVGAEVVPGHASTIMGVMMALDHDPNTVIRD